MTAKVLTIAACTLALLGAARAVPVPGQGTWDSALQARHLDGDGVVDAWYDRDRNVTWLARASPFGDADWNQARVGVQALQVAGVGGWRLPTIAGVPTCNGYTYDGSGWCGYNVDPGPSELAYFFQVLLGNRPYYDTSGNGPQPGWGLTNTGPFQNLLEGEYWTDVTSPDPAYPDFAWLYFAGWGYQDAGEKVLPLGVLALRDGDLAPIPEPGTWALLAAGLAALGLRRRRRAAAALGAVALALPLAAAAAPVLQDSTYSLFLRQMADRTEVGGIVFDSATQSFVHRVTAVDGTRHDVTVSVTESQSELADGSWSIRIRLQADADLFPWGDFAGFAYGSRPNDPLDLTGHWRLLSNVLTIRAGDEVLASGDWQPSTADFGRIDSWNGYFIAPGLFGALQTVSGRGADRLDFEMRVAAVPEPTSAALALLALAASGGIAQRRRAAAAARARCRCRHGAAAAMPADRVAPPPRHRVARTLRAVLHLAATALCALLAACGAAAAAPVTFQFTLPDWEIRNAAGQLQYGPNATITVTVDNGGTATALQSYAFGDITQLFLTSGGYSNTWLASDAYINTDPAYAIFFTDAAGTPSLDLTPEPDPGKSIVFSNAAGTWAFGLGRASQTTEYTAVWLENGPQFTGDASAFSTDYGNTVVIGSVVDPRAVPLPSSALLAALGLAGIACGRRRQPVA